MDINKKISQFSEVDKLDETTRIPIVQGTPLFNAKVSPKNLAKNIANDIAEELDIAGIDGKITAVEAGLLTKADKSSISKVDNTSDRDKPVSNATQLELNKKLDSLEAASTFIKKVTLNKVQNTADLDKPISTATQTELDKKVDNSRVLTNVPLNAVFTDTIVDISGKADKSYVDAKVKTNVPVGAVFTDTVVDVSNKVDKIEGKSLIANSEITRLANVTNQVVPTKTSELENDSRFVNSDDLAELGGGDMLKSVYDVDNSGVVDNAKKVNGFTVEAAVPRDAKFTDTIVDVEGLATKEELEDKVDKEFGMTLIDELEVERLSTVENQDISNLATKEELESKVDKVAGKSLLEDSEIERLRTLTSGGGPVPENVETTDNKKNTIDPASMTDYPTSMAVANYVIQNAGGFIDGSKLENLPDNRTQPIDLHIGQVNTLQSSRKNIVSNVLEGTEYTIGVEGWNNSNIEHYTMYFKTGEMAPTFKYSGFSPIWKDSNELVLVPNMFYELLFKVIFRQDGLRTVLAKYEVYDLSTVVVVVEAAGSDSLEENLITVGQTPDPFMLFPLDESTWLSMSDGNYIENAPITWTGWETEYDYNTVGEYVYLGHLGEEYDNREVRKVYKVVEPYVTSINYIDPLSNPLYVLVGTPKESIPFPTEANIYYSNHIHKYNVPILDFVLEEGYPEYNPNPDGDMGNRWFSFKPVFAEEYGYNPQISVEIVDELRIIRVDNIDLNVLVGTPEEEVPFPTEVTAKMSDGTEQLIPVTEPWVIQEGVYDSNMVWSNFTYTTTIDTMYGVMATLNVHIQPLQIVSTEPLEDIIVPYGTELNTITFPTETVATMSDETTQTLQINWNNQPAYSTPYYQAYSPGTYEFNGYFNDFEYSITVNVVVEDMVTVESYEPIANKEVPLGTTQEEIGLPTQMDVILSNGEAVTVDINWYSANPMYDANQANIYQFNGDSMEYMGHFEVFVKVGEPVLSEIHLPDVEVVVGNIPMLNQHMQLPLEQGGIANVTITWTHSVPEFDTNTLGAYIYHGTLDDLWGNYPVTQTVNVIEDYINSVHHMYTSQETYVLVGTEFSEIPFPETVYVGWQSGRYEELPVIGFVPGNDYPAYDKSIEGSYRFKPDLGPGYEYDENLGSGLWIDVEVIAEHRPKTFQDAYVEVEVGTPIEEIPFPTTVTAIMTDNTRQEVPVTEEWVVEGTYDPDMPHMNYNFTTQINGVLARCTVNVTPIRMVEHNPLADITVPYGTPQESIPFPAEVTGRLSDGTEVTTVSIDWSHSNPPYTFEEGTYVFNGHIMDYMYDVTVNVIVEAMIEA